jgi:hypothetical protein
MDSNQMAAKGLRSIHVFLIEVRDTRTGIIYVGTLLLEHLSRQ